MNRITINGVTIELPTDMHVSIVDGFVAVKHGGTKAVLDRPLLHAAAAEQPADPIKRDKVFDNLPAIIVKFLKAHQGKMYAIGISKHIAQRAKVKIGYQKATAIRAVLQEMVNDGTLVILKGGEVGKGQTLYGLAAMQWHDDRKPTPVTDWNTKVNNNHEVLHD